VAETKGEGKREEHGKSRQRPEERSKQGGLGRRREGGEDPMKRAKNKNEELLLR